MQIYNEKVFDLFHDLEEDQTEANSLIVREDKWKGMHVLGLTEYKVLGENECLRLLRKGEKNRITRATYMNQNSSRSHSIF